MRSPLSRCRSFGLLVVLIGTVYPIRTMGQTNKPNVVYFLVDNLGMGELSSYSGGPLRGVYTTRIDAFGKEGMPTAWWLRPDSSAARLGDQSAVVWKRLYLRPFAANFSAVGVWHGPPKTLDAPKPTSSSKINSTFGAPTGGRNGVIGGNFVSGSFAS